MNFEYIEAIEILKKYRLAGKIRFISFLLLFFLLLLMKLIGGYGYLNFSFILLILVEAVANQPHAVVLCRVDIRRFQYFQMMVDIIAISWVLYYMGGIEAPVVGIAYYAIILWAGVASSTRAVIFAVVASAFSYSAIILMEYFGGLPHLSYTGYAMPFSQVMSILIGNVAFIFAFGYFSANSSLVIKELQRKKQEEELRGAHKLIAAGLLMSRTAHDVLNNISNTKGYVRLLLEGTIGEAERMEMLRSVEHLQARSADLVQRLGRFSQDSSREFAPVDIHRSLEEALALADPVVRYTMVVEKKFAAELPPVMASATELQEAFVALILNAADACAKDGNLVITTHYAQENRVITITFTDNGESAGRDELRVRGEAFFIGTTPEKGLGLAAAYEIIERHKGHIDVVKNAGKGNTFTITLTADK